MKKVLITGINGQDGSFLAEMLLKKGDQVHGLIRRSSFDDKERKLKNLFQIVEKINFHVVNIEEVSSLLPVVEEIQPDECYHLAAQSFVSYSFNDEFSTIKANLNGTHNLLAAIKDISPRCKFYFAGSSEMFGHVDSSPQNEMYPFHPRSIYGISKVAGYHLAKYYRENYGLFICNGILFNHESERRSHQFVTRKITNTVAKIKLGLENTLLLGNLDAKRDWGYAPEYVEAMWLMLQKDDPDDYVIGTGITHSVRDFVSLAFSCLNLDWEKHVKIDPKFFRPTQQIDLCADTTKAKKLLGWQSNIEFSKLVEKMVKNDLEIIKQKSG